MGRHRRSAAVPAAVDYGEAGRHRGRGRARRKSRVAPVRTGLLGVSAAAAVGAVAMASGLLPGGGNAYNVGGGDPSGDQVRADGVPDLQTQGGESATPSSTATSPSPSSGATRAHAPSTSPSPVAPKTSAPPSKVSSAPSAPTRSASATPSPTKTAAKSAVPLGKEAAAQAAVLSLVNKERATAGCSPVTANGPLAALATAFSEDMAARNFFDHTDPDGKSPWDRADAAGVSGLGGENIARGQADAEAVMDAWMNSPGHRANILNCDYKTLGVGVHFGSGGPWWTQDFGF
ncbi:CAP domain-containing protein [Streptomyces sp. NBC_01465]|uniref:CAP domain-containing protein n=1 Tax=Streptomyces sp. NBC_01465 TaxID=2903878 RepID=UPI002E2F097A|nr:CAP domain-containing protein [Streptomyces sp. NBC_01465]